MVELPRPNTDNLTDEQQRYFDTLERLVGAKTIAVASNGRFPAWSVERWLLVVGFALSICSNAFWVGTKVQAVESRVSVLERNEDQWARKAEVDLQARNLQAQIDRKADRP